MSHFVIEGLLIGEFQKDKPKPVLGAGPIVVFALLEESLSQFSDTLPRQAELVPSQRYRLLHVDFLPV